ncbi:hypothetical protein LCGC14_0263700 [marine sediment metagenome]|uniref:Uncharacterized protein n=1 Tax=marine sediment metagenome TaxID=412755 RepID=A0A0F9WLB4_9ZZZZ
MSENELDKVIWQESHAADERERHLDRLKELTGRDYVIEDDYDPMFTEARNFLRYCIREHPSETAEDHMKAIVDEIHDNLKQVVKALATTPKSTDKEE